MGESEPLEKNVKAAEVALKAEKAQVEAEKQQARERTAVDAGSPRAILTRSAPKSWRASRPPVTSDTNGCARRADGIGVAEAVDGRCTGCNMAMRLQFFQDLKRGDEVMACESCLRILYYNPPVATRGSQRRTGARGTGIAAGPLTRNS